VILHSIIPYEKIYEGYTENNIKEFVEINYKGEKVLAAAMGNSEYMITRVISTWPKAYLNPELQPGTIIRLGDTP
jgi:hypothetical protein